MEHRAWGRNERVVGYPMVRGCICGHRRKAEDGRISPLRSVVQVGLPYCGLLMPAPTFLQFACVPSSLVCTPAGGKHLAVLLQLSLLPVFECSWEKRLNSRLYLTSKSQKSVGKVSPLLGSVPHL